MNSRRGEVSLRCESRVGGEERERREGEVLSMFEGNEHQKEGKRRRRVSNDQSAVGPTKSKVSQENPVDT